MHDDEACTDAALLHTGMKDTECTYPAKNGMLHNSHFCFALHQSPASPDIAHHTLSALMRYKGPVTHTQPRPCLMTAKKN